MGAYGIGCYYDYNVTDEYEYTGADISIPAYTVVESFINIPDFGTVQDINIMINFDWVGGANQQPYVLDCSLISPYGTTVAIFEYSNIDGPTMYLSLIHI